MLSIRDLTTDVECDHGCLEEENAQERRRDADDEEIHRRTSGEV